MSHMEVMNVHERDLSRAAGVGELIDGLASRDDPLWPQETWPPMRFDRPLGVGAREGHGPIRYHVVEYEPGERVRFRFTAPRGFVGFHEYRLVTMPQRLVLQHVCRMRLEGFAWLTWPLVWRPMHDALIEDSLDRAELATSGVVERAAVHFPWVRLLRSGARATTPAVR